MSSKYDLSDKSKLIDICLYLPYKQDVHCLHMVYNKIN